MKRSEMNSSGRQAMGRRLPLAFLALLVTVPVSAQTDTVNVVRRVSSWQKDVDQLRKELLEKRRMEFELVRMLQNLERQRTVASDSQLTNLRVQSQFVVTQLRSALDDQSRLRKQLETVCAEVQKPEGWLGVVTTGIQLLDRQPNGLQIRRFLEPPLVASVDPGSPAERVGVRTGDELVEIGGKRLLNANVVFAEILRPGEKVVVKLRRGNEIITLEPRIEPTPQVTLTPCSWVDGSTAYAMVTSPAQFRGEVQAATGGAGGFVYTTTTPRRDSTTGAVARMAPRPAAQNEVVAVGPMTRMYTVGSSLAGLELMALTEESGRAFGVSYGLFVNQVLPGTPGRDAGLQGGDVLVAADSTPLRSLVALRRAIDRSRTRDVSITVMRRGKAETVQLKW